jgi:hypothetical protein
LANQSVSPSWTLALGRAPPEPPAPANASLRQRSPALLIGAGNGRYRFQLDEAGHGVTRFTADDLSIVALNRSAPDDSVVGQRQILKLAQTIAIGTFEKAPSPTVRRGIANARQCITHVPRLPDV